MTDSLKKLCGLIPFAALICQAEDTTWVYSVQISAKVQTAPPRITLEWPPDDYGATNFAVSRKVKEATTWGAKVFLPGTATNFVDTDVDLGEAYEYRITKAGTRGYTGYGYIYAGINAPLIERRGKLVLMVATNSTAALEYELSRLQTDLVGDGWEVIRHDISSNQTPEYVKSLIIGDYWADPDNVNAAYLFGHVPILQSGNLDYDGHLFRPMPADSYYADMDAYWPTDPDFSPSYLPSDLELMIGRVDLFNMPGVGAPAPWVNETELLRNYLNKDHNWRHNRLRVSRQALMGNLIGDLDGEAPAAAGYRNFQPLVGPGNTIRANVEAGAPAYQRWISLLSANSYLWAYGCGAGQNTAMSMLGTADGPYQDVRSIDMVSQDAQAVFVMCFGSWFGNWDSADNIMRSVLATPSIGLTACLAGRPHWFFHHMALGEPIGYSTRLTMNNSTLYQNHTNTFTRAVHVALMGDPTLRMDPVSPPANLTGAANGGTVTLNWSDSLDSIQGYHVYRATSRSGPFSRLTFSILEDTTFTDWDVPSNDSDYTYMVRAVKLQTTPSGTYFNPSQGSFVAISIPGELPPIRIRITYSSGQVTLTWNSRSGAVHHVEAKANLSDGWFDISGSITATGPTVSWTDGWIDGVVERYYRVTAP